jgi:hypothetical protein
MNGMVIDRRSVRHWRFDHQCWCDLLNLDLLCLGFEEVQESLGFQRRCCCDVVWCPSGATSPTASSSVVLSAAVA